MMNRRAFLTGFGAVLATPLAAGAQRGTAIPRIGYLTPVSQAGGTASINAFRDGLREHGYVDGTNVVIEPRFADGYERVPALVAELLNLKVNVLVVATTPVALAAQRATSTVPIVFARSRTRSGLALWQVWRDQVAISPAILIWLLVSPRSASPSCLRRYRICLGSAC